MIPWGSNGSQSKNSAAEAGSGEAALLSLSDVPVDAVERWPSSACRGWWGLLASVATVRTDNHKARGDCC